MNKLLATRISKTEDEAFKTLAKKYKLTKSALLRIIVSTIITDKNDELIQLILKRISNEQHAQK